MSYSANKNICSILWTRKGYRTMSKNEMELLELIREHDNPEQALITAVEVVISFLTQHGSSE